MNERDPESVAVVAEPGLWLMELSVPARVLGLALPGQGVAPFRVRFVTVAPGRLPTADGIDVRVEHGLDALATAGIVIVPTWHIPPLAEPAAPELLDALRGAHDEGAIVAGLCLGAFVLGAAGLLDGREATTHWAFAEELAGAFPAARIDPAALYLDTGSVLTSAGSAAGIDACLHLVRRLRGAATAKVVAQALVIAPHRRGDQAQFIASPVPTHTRSDPIGRAMTDLLADLDRPVEMDAVAASCGLGRRSFYRRFRERTGSTPLHWLIAQRVVRAQEMLETTEHGIDQIARAVGFADAVSLRPHFRRLVGVSPRDYRAAFTSQDR